PVPAQAARLQQAAPQGQRTASARHPAIGHRHLGNETFKSQLDLEQHRGRTPGGVVARVMQRILAAIWHNDQTGQPVLRSLTAYDH
ncbi:hypothetical protein ACWEPT_44520, partial [Streptomyces chartreusis]